MIKKNSKSVDKIVRSYGHLKQTLYYISKDLDDVELQAFMALVEQYTFRAMEQLNVDERVAARKMAINYNKKIVKKGDD